MRQQQSTILYAFIALIILAGLGLFIFKDNIASQFLANNINGPVISVNKGSSELNLDVLRDARIKALKNYVSVFDYANMNKSQDIIQENLSKQSDVVISNPDGTASTSASTTTKNIIRIRLGNSNPFIKAK